MPQRKMAQRDSVVSLRRMKWTTEWGSQITDAFADVGVDALIAISDTAGAEHLSPDALDIVGTNGVGKDGMQIVDSGR